VRHDPEAIEDVVANLLGNAWKYRSGDPADVRLDLVPRRRTVRLVVADDGIGIRRADRRKVFGMFFRAEAYLTGVPGTGLGLSLVRTLVRGHGGRVRVAGIGLAGRGTTFEVVLPLARRAEAARAADDRDVTRAGPARAVAGAAPRPQPPAASPAARPASNMGGP
jgi:two-component system phosphate regulon sensor histidine kinase PhoR